MPEFKVTVERKSTFDIYIEAESEDEAADEVLDRAKMGEYDNEMWEDEFEIYSTSEE